MKSPFFYDFIKFFKIFLIFWLQTLDNLTMTKILAMTDKFYLIFSNRKQKERVFSTLSFRTAVAVYHKPRWCSELFSLPRYRAQRIRRSRTRAKANG